MRLEKQILVGFGIGLAVGAIARAPAMGWFATGVVALEPIGTAFIRLVTMAVYPLAIASVFCGVASLGDIRSLGRVGGRTLFYFATTTLAAAVIGLMVAMAMHVGAGVDATSLGARDIAASTQSPTIVQTVLGMVPQNPFAAAANGDLLALIIAVCIFGAAATAIDGEGKRAVVKFFQGINELSIVVIGWLMKLAPIAVCVLIAAVVARSGWSMLAELAAFAAAVLIGLAVHTGLVLLPWLIGGAKIGVKRFFRATSDALLLAFSTASSNTALPVSMAAANQRLDVPEEIVGFVLPAGASLNKNGAAVYKAVTAVFLAQLFGVPLDTRVLMTIALTSTLAAFAGTGVPGSSLVTTLIVLNAIGLGPRAATGIALVAAIDRPLDMCRSCVNTIGNLVGAVWIARGERVAAWTAVAERAVVGRR